MATRLYTSCDERKVTLKRFGKAWRDRIPMSGVLPERLERALQRLAAKESEGRASDAAGASSGHDTEPSSDGSDQGTA